MKSRTLTIALLCAAFVVAVVASGCGAAGGPKAADLDGAWVLESFGAPEGLYAADSAIASELILGSGKATGSGGVNSFGGTYNASDGGKLAFGPIVSTKKAGSPEAMKQEAAFFEVLDKTKRFEFNEGKLVLGNLDNDTLAILVPK